MNISKNNNNIFGLPSTSKFLYKNSQNYAIYLQKVSSGASVNMHFYVVDPNNKLCGEPISLKPSQLMKPNGFTFIYDLIGGFKHDDEANIRQAYCKLEPMLPCISADEKVAFEVVYNEICSYSLGTISSAEGQRYINIKTHDFRQFVAESDWGWTSLEVQKQLRGAGLLRRNEKRPYDYSIAGKDGKNIRHISVLMDKLPTGDNENEGVGA